MEDINKESGWSETVVLVDAGYVDRVARDLTVYFERALDRRIPPGDLARWIDCVALDGGVRPGDNAVQVVFFYDKKHQGLENFVPSRFQDELDGQAFRDNLGEFTLQSFAVEEVVTFADFFRQSFEMALAASTVKRLIVVSDENICATLIREVAAGTSETQITFLTMSPLSGRGFQQELLGYSLMSALGIQADELK